MHTYGPPRSGGGAIGWLLAAVIFTILLSPPSVARSSPTPTGGGRATQAVAYAKAQTGKPYRWGAEGPNSFDCSGLTWAAWRSAGVSVPRTAATQLAGLPKATGRLRAGDLVIYRTNGPSRRHVAMVLNPEHMIEARGRGVPVRVTRLRPGFIGAVRP
jgi:peptidoglycan DL-endopeptidase CwlO